MAVERQNNSPDSPARQGLRSVPAPSNVVLLHDLEEIHALWGKNVETVYRAVRDGKLRAYGRPGRQKYYSEAELISAFGEPPNQPRDPGKTKDNATGGYPQQGDLGLDVAA
jgi:hypothetical protein